MHAGRTGTAIASRWSLRDSRWNSARDKSRPSTSWLANAAVARLLSAGSEGGSTPSPRARLIARSSGSSTAFLAGVVIEQAQQGVCEQTRLPGAAHAGPIDTGWTDGDERRRGEGRAALVSATPLGLHPADQLGLAREQVAIEPLPRELLHGREQELRLERLHDPALRAEALGPLHQARLRLRGEHQKRHFCAGGRG